MEDAIVVEKDGPVARLILNRPTKHNALKFADLDVLVDALHDAENDDAIKVIILKGRGPSFCAGHDYNDAIKSYGLESAGDGQADGTGGGKTEAMAKRRPSQRSRLMRDR